MDFPSFKLLVTLMLLKRIGGLPLACSYNGTSYGKGETVRTEDPCLFCLCQKGLLECSLRVCAEQPTALPTGCFLVHKPNDCCPQLFCEEEEKSNPFGVELRTDFKLEKKQNGNDCVINGSIYGEGSTVASTGLCEYCYCIEGELKCLKPRCLLQSFEGCTPIYEKSSCCPTQYDCRNANVDTFRAQVKTLDSEVSNDSSRTLDNSKDLNKTETMSELTEKIKNQTEELNVKTTDETTADEMTMTPGKEATTVFEDDFLTSFGFQTVNTENLNKETTTVNPTALQQKTALTAEATTVAFLSEETENAEKLKVPQSGNFPEATESPVESSDDNGDNSSQEVDEYDSYDYSEPRLPPSLPNLVIFPFVAADAVIREETDDTFDGHDRTEIKRNGNYPVFHKDRFSPPMKTEGGFVPKQPSRPIEPFYEFDHFREEQNSSTPDSNQAVNCKDNICLSANGKDTQRKTVGYVNATADSVVEEKGKSSFGKNHQNKKPVTVTYKNVVVDFYPNYLITTTRSHPETDSWKSPAKENHSIPKESLPQPFSAAVVVESNSSFSPMQTSPSTSRTTEESSLLDKIFNSFFPEVKTSTEATTLASVNQKYSSKIKGQTNAPAGKPKEVSPTNSLFKVVTGSENSGSSKPKIYSSSLKQVKKEGIKSFTNTSLKELPLSTASVETKGDESETQNLKEADEGGISAGALLKLAGCNIYGMMYRVGKVIVELSGPCVECLCTDLGVQCRSLKC